MGTTKQRWEPLGTDGNYLTYMGTTKQKLVLDDMDGNY